MSAHREVECPTASASVISFEVVESTTMDRRLIRPTQTSISRQTTDAIEVYRNALVHRRRNRSVSLLLDMNRQYRTNHEKVDIHHVRLYAKVRLLVGHNLIFVAYRRADSGWYLRVSLLGWRRIRPGEISFVTLC